MKTCILFCLLLSMALILITGCQDDPADVALQGVDKDLIEPLAGGGGPPLCNDVEVVTYVPADTCTTGIKHPADFYIYPYYGSYKIYHINGPGWFLESCGKRGGRWFGYSYTSDFESYASVDSVKLRHFGTNDTGWSSEHIWAPHIVKEGSTYYMFYTGVDYTDDGATDEDDWSQDGSEKQAIGLVTSSSIAGPWTYHNSGGDNDGFLFDVSGESGLMYDSTWGGHCRDPHVFDNGSEWGMVLVVRKSNWKISIGYATASDLDGTWEFQYVFDIADDPDTGHGNESPGMFKYNGTWYLYWTESCYGTAHTPAHDPEIHFATASTISSTSFSSKTIHGTYGAAAEVYLSDNDNYLYSALQDGGIHTSYFKVSADSVVTLNDCMF